MSLKHIFFLLIITITACKTGSTKKIGHSEFDKTHKRLEYLIKNDSTAAFKKVFKKTHFDPNHSDFGTPLLFNAVSKNNEEITDFLLKKGADINYISKYGTVMHWALESENTKMGNLLLNNGFDASIEKKMIKNPEPLNVLTAFLVEKNDENILLFKKLLDSGMNPDLRDKDGACSLILASYFSKPDLISLLHKNGADMNIRAVPDENNPNLSPTEFTTNQYTALMIATLFEKTEIVAQLLSYPEVDTTITGIKNQKTAYDIALDTKNKDLIALFQ
ncbi:ankyrin repeat domain-containing protein [Zunongwangia pacifica]|uniref:Ankyrin repeat domain-containing protein n=1 Tax=Zunongwangia pacifica TaxID=2911062 RepID=A0A9X1ZT11_9FLAO|nr:ankyrin repeat domain-containing protein [Zunongwangia pacifica]MCL6217163.1 ankyrin repeat domain-containing protein [Zunongwangia pacifica]